MLIIAHRSNGSKYQENTLKAIKEINTIGIDMIEVDVRVTKDKIPVLYHDSYIPSANNKLYIESENFSDLKNCDKELTTLEDALNIKANYLLDIKPKTNLKPVIEIIEKNGSSKEILITSFDYGLLKSLKKEMPNINLAILDRWSGVRASSRAKKLGTNTIIMNQKWLWNGFIKSMTNSGYKLYAYTLNDKNRTINWKKRGLSGVITDIPSFIKESSL